MFKSILVPIDVAHASSWEQALPLALELTGGRGIVSVVTVIPELASVFESLEASFHIEGLVVAARKRLQEIVAATAPGAKLPQEVRSGSIPHEIMSAAKAQGADLIVMASRRPEMLEYPVGPNAAQVVRHAPCSVLVLRDGKRP